MTRGKIVCITKEKKLLSSTEFNGDMDPAVYGADVLKLLSYVEDEEEFAEAVSEFNKSSHNYDDDPLLYPAFAIDDMLDMSDYFDKWFSDYLYIKNLTDDVAEWIDREGCRRKILPDETVVIHFGRYTGLTDDNIEHYNELRESFSELTHEDAVELVENKKDICGIYEDTYDIGREYAVGIDDWLNNDRYINFDAIGEDMAEDTSAWFLLPSGRYAHLC